MKTSAGILVYRLNKKALEVLLVHPGGPFWKNKEEGAWSIPKGEFIAEEEDGLVAARREFEEETGLCIEGDFTALSPLKQKSGKLIYAWAIEKDLDAAAMQSNFFEMEWPPKSGRLQRFPEADQAAWFEVDVALQKINPGQAGFIQQLIEHLK